MSPANGSRGRFVHVLRPAVGRGLGGYNRPESGLKHALVELIAHSGLRRKRHELIPIGGAKGFECFAAWAVGVQMQAFK